MLPAIKELDFYMALQSFSFFFTICLESYYITDCFRDKITRFFLLIIQIAVQTVSVLCQVCQSERNCDSPDGPFNMQIINVYVLQVEWGNHSFFLNGRLDRGHRQVCVLSL